MTIAGLDGATAVVTGGGSGIGAAVVRLHELWARVVAQVLESCALGVRVAVPAPR